MASRKSPSPRRALYERAAKHRPPRLPGNVDPTPAEDDALFNPLVHGNKRMGRRNLGPTRPKRY